MSITGKLFVWVCTIIWLLFLIALVTTLFVLFLKYVGWVLSTVMPIIGGLGL